MNNSTHSLWQGTIPCVWLLWTWLYPHLCHKLPNRQSKHPVDFLQPHSRGDFTVETLPSPLPPTLESHNSKCLALMENLSIAFLQIQSINHAAELSLNHRNQPPTAALKALTLHSVLRLAEGLIRAAGRELQCSPAKPSQPALAQPPLSRSKERTEKQGSIGPVCRKSPIKQRPLRWLCMCASPGLKTILHTSVDTAVPQPFPFPVHST